MCCTVHSYNLPAVWATERVIANRAIFAPSLGNLKSSDRQEPTCGAWMLQHFNQGHFNNLSRVMERFSSSRHLPQFLICQISLLHPWFSVMLLGLKRFVRVKTNKCLHAFPILAGLNASWKEKAILWESCLVALLITSLESYRDLLFWCLICIVSQFLPGMISQLGKLSHNHIKGFFFKGNEWVNNNSRNRTDNKTLVSLFPAVPN